MLRKLLPVCFVMLAFPAYAQGPEAPVGAFDPATLRDAISRAENGDASGALDRAGRLGDPIARTLVEWFAMRAGGDGVTSARIARFLIAHPNWPGDKALRARAEGQILTESHSPEEVIAFFRNGAPRTAPGRVALAIALKERGQVAEAQRLIHEAWRTQDISSTVERIASERLAGFVTKADEKARMERLLYKEEAGEALKLAERLGGIELQIARARAAVIRKASNAGALLEAVPASAQSDPGYMFSRAQWLRRNDREKEAAQILLAAPRDPAVLVDPDEWWTERRLVARKLLDDGDARTAYRLAAGHSALRDLERMDAEFHAGWIALRFLNDPATADRHFAELEREAVRKISVARAAYWRGRAAEAAGDVFGARNHYEAAARYRTTYYGQLAMAKLGHTQLTVASATPIDEAKRAQFDRRDTVRAIRLLHAAGLDDKARPFFADMADDLSDPEELALLAKLGNDIGQLRYSLLVGKQALLRGAPLEHFAFPTNGVPDVASVGPSVERAVVLALARQESTFDPKIRSSAGAVGLMQMLPASAAQTARKFGVPWQPGRITDPAYNAQLGSAYLGESIQEFGGSYILAFAAYNAGRARVREWIARMGDPRDPRVDPVDWVERIPFSETRNYVMRVMENVQVYRARLGAPQLLIERDLHRHSSGPATAATE